MDRGGGERDRSLQLSMLRPGFTCGVPISMTREVRDYNKDLLFYEPYGYRHIYNTLRTDESIFFFNARGSEDATLLKHP